MSGQPAGLHVEVVKEIAQRNECVRVSVADTGVGIAPEEQEKIFSEFHQADRVRDEQLGGTGIGLALTRRLVELHGGTIGLNSTLGEGSTFWFTLPLHEQHQAKLVMDSSAGLPVVHGTARRILVAEDNEGNIALMVDMLQVQGHEVFLARNGREAIELAEKHNPDLILMDLRMPEMDGLEATRHLRTIAAFLDTPIIMVTASAGSEAREMCLAAGCTDHLPKPVQTKELFRALQTYLP